MTFVGKILVIVLMVFALFFLALSTVVFTTSVNWKDQVTKLETAKKKLDDDLRRVKAEVDTQKFNLQTAKDEFGKQETNFKNQIKNVTEERDRYSTEVTKQRTAVETALQESRSSQQEAEARTSETKKLREILASVQEQTNEFKLQKTDLDQQIVVLKRELNVATDNNKDLRDRVAILQTSMKKAGVEADPKVLAGIGIPPDVEGEVTKVNSNNNLVEISIGSNDGLVRGHVLDLYRTKPVAAYLGKVMIIETDPNQASARVVGKTVHGQKIQEGDNVTTKIRARG